MVFGFRAGLFSFLLFLASMKCASCLVCFNSEGGYGNTHVEECWNEYSDQHICVKLLMPAVAEIPPTDIRRCETKGACDYALNGHCFECQTDLCNSSLALTPFISVIVWCLIKHCLF